VHLLTVPAAVAQTVKISCKLGQSRQSAGVEATVYGIRAHDLIDVDAKLTLKTHDGTVVHEKTFASLGLPFARTGPETAEFDVTVFANISNPELWYVELTFSHQRRFLDLVDSGILAVTGLNAFIHSKLFY
jgi:hypothetical protein